MEYIKKEELIEGEIYKVSNNSLTLIMKATKDLNNVINIPSYNEFMKSGNFNGSHLTFTNATSEEKHWLNTCITEDKFITFEEAMKTFIPEYVELLHGWSVGGEFVGKIFDTKKDFQKQFKGFKSISSHWDWSYLNTLSNWKEYFKPSTKEAYDAQFVVKEPKFVLPKLWHIIITPENYEILSKYFLNKHPRFSLYTKGVMGVYREDMYREDRLGHTKGNIKGYGFDFGQEITFEQFKKYVLKDETVEEVKVVEPLPQFKVIESIETITKVENNEGNQFFIGDKVITPLNNIIRIISSFTYNQDKTELYANFKETLDVISINKLEHYIEPKIVESEFVLPKKWCIRGNKQEVIDYSNLHGQLPKYYINDLYHHYPPFSSNCTTSYEIKPNYTEITFDQFKKHVLKEEVKEETLLEKAKIIEYLHDFKVGDKIKSKYSNDIWEITKIEGNQLIFETNNLPKINSILAKNAIKIIKVN